MPMIIVEDQDTLHDLYVAYNREHVTFRDIIDGVELVTTWTELYQMLQKRV